MKKNGGHILLYPQPRAKISKKQNQNSLREVRSEKHTNVVLLRFTETTRP